MALITIEQYGVRVGQSYSEESPSTEEEQILAFLDDASALVNLIAFGTTEADYWDDADESSGDNPVPDSIIPVIVNMVQRGLDNPLGLVGEQIGAYSWQAASGQATAIYVTRDERRIIRRAAGKLGVNTIQLEGYLPVSSVEFIEDDLTENL